MVALGVGWRPLLEGNFIKRSQISGFFPVFIHVLLGAITGPSEKTSCKHTKHHNFI